MTDLRAGAKKPPLAMNAAMLLLLIQRRPGLTKTRLMEALNFDAEQIAGYIDTLTHRDLIRRELHQRQARYWPINEEQS